MVYNVTTWEQFERAFTSSHDISDPDEDVIEILADIDLNDVAISNPLYVGAKKTINGNSHTIYNLKDGTNTRNNIISCGEGTSAHPFYAITWNKLNFDNLFAVLNTTWVFAGAPSYSMVFNDCTFVATCNELFRYATLNRCAVTFNTITANDTPFGYVTSNFCWYHVTIRKTASTNTSSMFKPLNTCYVDGKILCPAPKTGPIGQLTNCCINVECDATMTKLSSSSNTPISVYNNEKIPTVTTADVNSVGCTDTQLKDANYLASIGFAIIAQAGE